MVVSVELIRNIGPFKTFEAFVSSLERISHLFIVSRSPFSGLKLHVNHFRSAVILSEMGRSMPGCYG